MALPIIAGIGRYVPTIAQKLGVGRSMASVMNFARQNPTTFLLAAKETYDQGVSLYDSIAQEAPEAIAELQRMASEQFTQAGVDPVKPGMLDQLDQLQDEMETIDAAVRIIGGYDALQTLRRVLSFDDAHFDMYLRVRRLARSVI